MEHPGATPRIFISYSHDDEEWKDSVVSQLGVLEYEGLLSVWEDRRIDAGDEWLPEIEKAIDSCNVALLLISAKFLTSKFILNKEVPTLLKRREQEGVRVIPVILKPCAWTQVNWLKSIQSRPRDGKALSGMSEHEADAALAALAGEVADLLARTPSLRKPNTPQVIPPLTTDRTEPSAGAANFPGREAELKPVNDARADGENTQAGPAADQKDDSGPKPGRLTWLFSQRRQILIGLLLGVLLGLGLHYLHAQLTVLRAVDDLAMDFLLRLQWSTPIRQPALSFVLLDIDEQTYQAWKAPSFVPRDRLLKLIQYAVEGGAALVVVAIDLSQTGNDRAAAQQLKDYLANYGTAGKSPLLLVRTFDRPTVERPYWIVQRSFLEADSRIVDSPLIHWGQAKFEQDQDQLWRRWWLWTIGCDEHGQPVVIPAVQLLAVMMTQPATDPQKASKRLQNELNNQLHPEYCGQSLAGKDGKLLQIAGMTLTTQAEDLSQRIIYRLPPRPLPHGQDYPQILQPDGRLVPSLSVFSAKSITDSDKPTAKTELAGRVVVIGGSFQDQGYLTPLGRMSGPLMLINAIHSLQQQGLLKLPPLWIKLLITVLLIIVISVISVIFARFPSFRAMLLCILIISITLLPISYSLFNEGIWLDLVLPLFVVWGYWRWDRGRG